jgi:hypothetical protein
MNRGTTYADEKKLRTLGEAWIAFYQDHLTQAEPHDVYRALVLASVPACGPVMAELAEILRGHSTDKTASKHSMSMRLFEKGSGYSAKGELLQRVSGTKIHRDFQESQKYHQQQLREAYIGRQIRRKSSLPSVDQKSHRTASVYAMDDLLRDHAEVKLPRDTQQEGKFKAERRVLKNAKGKGEAVDRVNDLLRQKSLQEPGAEHLQYLLPLQRMPSPLDEDVFIDGNEYVGFPCVISMI